MDGEVRRVENSPCLTVASYKNRVISCYIAPSRTSISVHRHGLRELQTCLQISRCIADPTFSYSHRSRHVERSPSISPPIAGTRRPSPSISYEITAMVVRDYYDNCTMLCDMSTMRVRPTKKTARSVRYLYDYWRVVAILQRYDRE